MSSVFTNTFIASFGRVLNTGLGIITVALITRQLGPSNYGAFILLLSFGTIVQLISDAGLYLTFTKEVAQSPAPIHLLSEVISLRLFLLLLAFISGALLFPFIPSLHGWFKAYLLIALGLIFQSLSQLLVGVFQYQSEIWRATLGDLFGRVVQILLLIGLWTFSSSVVSIALIFAVSTAFTLLLHQILLPRPFLFSLRINLTSWRRLLKVSWPLGLMLFLNAIYFRVDTLILSFFRDAAEVGRYGVAYRVIESSLFFPAMLGGLLLPHISAALSRHDLSTASRYLSEGLRLILAVIIPLLVILIFLGRPVIYLVSGTQFLSSAPILATLSFALLIMYFGNLFGFVLVALNKQKTLLKLSAFLVIFNLCLNLIFIPLGGALAAAWTTVFTELISAGTAGILVFRAFPFYLPLRFCARVLLVGLIGLCSVCLSSFLSGLEQVILVGLILVVATLIFRVVSKKELSLLRTIRTYA